MIKLAKIQYYLNYHFPEATIIHLGYLAETNNKIFGHFTKLSPSEMDMIKNKEAAEKIKNLKILIENMVGYGCTIENLRQSFSVGPIHITNPIDFVSLNNCEIYRNYELEDSEKEIKFISDIDLDETEDGECS